MIKIFQRIGSIVFLSLLNLIREKKRSKYAYQKRIGYGIANIWRGTVDSALGTTSYETDASSAKYTSDYKTAKEVMDELKELQYWRKIILYFLSDKKIKKIEKTLEKSAPRVYTS